MNTILGSLSGIQWIEVARIMIDLLVKGAFLCGFAGVVTLFMRRSPAYARKAVWVAVLAALIILPLSSLIVPAWEIPILPAIGGERLISGELEFADEESSGSLSPPAPVAGGVEAPGSTGLLDGYGRIGLGWIALVWLAGFMVCTAWFAISRYLLRRLVSHAEPLGGSWEGLMAALSVQLGVRRGVRLLKSKAITAAMTAGCVKPVIILPGRADGWSETRRRLVLSHELAHVKRWDSLIDILGFAAAALHWFNPLAWLALSRLRIERERDCDNAVLNSGAKPSDYASLLMEIATDMQRRNRPMWQVAAISEGSSLKDRLLCILDPKMDRRSGNLGSVFMIGLLVVAFTIPLSGSRLWKKAVVELAGGGETEQEQCDTEKEKKAEASSDREVQEQKLKEAELKKKKAAGKVVKKVKPVNVREKIETGMKDDKTRGTSAARVIGLSAYDGGVKAAKASFKELQAAKGEYYFDEKEFNRIGYMLLSVEKVDEAAAIFQINVKMYPESWNVYDSLGEAYLMKGDYSKAVDLYEKSLEINPDNENGRKMLKVIQEKTS